MSKLNFAIALKMTTDQFKQGADIVKNGLRNIQYQVLGMASALGLGTIGLKNMISGSISVARETTSARVALRNISGDAGGFAKNMDFLVGSSNRWGQELNGMTAEFAKFSAAATSAGISIEDQHSIFESFTRSITAFGMSSADAHLAYLALSQMMSKGKVSSEELRRQLGERMPVAMEAMARAVGVTIQELDGLLKAGKIISKEVMLPFVKEMEKMLPEVNVDNIETSINRLKNSFTKLTQDLKIGEFYKKIVDGANNMLSNIQTSFVRIATVIASSIFGGKIVKSFTQLLAKTQETNARMVADKIKTEEQATLATAKRVAAENRYNEMSVLYSKAGNDTKLQYYAKLVSYESAMDKARLREKAAILAADTAAAAKTTTVWALAWGRIKAAGVAAAATIRAMLSSFVAMAVIGVVTNFVMKLIEARKEAQRIKNIFNDNRASVFGVADTSEIQKLQTLNKIVTERLGTNDEIKNVQNELLKMLGIESGKQVDINKEVAKRIELLREAARAEQAAQNNAQLEQRNREIIRKMSPIGDAISVRQYLDAYEKLEEDRKTYNIPHGEMVKQQTLLATAYNVRPNDNELNELTQNLRAINENNKILENAVRREVDTTKPTDDDKKETPLEKAEKKYAEELKKLTNQKSAGVITTEEYNKALDKLNESIYEEIGGILGSAAERNKTFQKAKQGVENPLAPLNELSDLTKDYNRSLKELDEKKRLGLISEEQYNDELINLINATQDKIASFKCIGDAEEEYIASLKKIKDGIGEKQTLRSRDTTFDYKKSESDILKEDYSLQEEYVEKLKEKVSELKNYTGEALDEIKKEEENLTSLSDAIKLAELKEDIEKMNLDVFSESVSGVTGFADGLDRVVNSWSRIANEDLSGFERMVAIINALGDTIKGVISAWESYKAIRDIVAAREMAIHAQNDASTVAEVAGIAAVTEAKAGADVAEATSAATKSAAIVTALTAEEIAAKGVMAAQSAAAYAYIPFAGVGLAAGQIAAMQGLIVAAKVASAIPGFKDGGIVNSVFTTGDKNVVRVNGGEMIMTTAQQSKLWDAIEKGNFGGLNGNVRFEIEGNKLAGVLEQQRIKKSRV